MAVMASGFTASTPGMVYASSSLHHRESTWELQTPEIFSCSHPPRSRLLSQGEAKPPEVILGAARSPQLPTTLHRRTPPREACRESPPPPQPRRCRRGRLPSTPGRGRDPTYAPPPGVGGKRCFALPGREAAGGEAHRDPPPPPHPRGLPPAGGSGCRRPRRREAGGGRRGPAGAPPPPPQRRRQRPQRPPGPARRGAAPPPVWAWPAGRGGGVAGGPGGFGAERRQQP
ncbi:proline-rich protein 2-like [Chroicocephalus ridibundus]|uniref:proline-rich protein 2-like n=1 Tax=Chroicocephalus ridibundus TaxID=1192867 RepID=UPI002FDD2AA9